MTVLAHRWSALSLLHGRIESRVEHALKAAHRLEARPTHNAVLREALDRAAAEPELAPLVHAVQQLQGAVQPL